MPEIINMPLHEGEPDRPFSVRERILAQKDIVASVEGTDEEERRRLMDENSDPFKQLEGDSEFRRLIREGNFEEARGRIEAFKEKQKRNA